MNKLDVSEVKLRYSMKDILERLGIEINKKGFICCPFHNEKTPSLKIYEHSYFCFGCGTGGDVIDFVKHYLNLTFPEAIEYLGGATLSFSEQRKIMNRKRDYDKAKSEEQERKQKYDALMDKWIRLDRQRKEFAPVSQFEQPHEKFIEAIKELPRIEHELDNLK